MNVTALKVRIYTILFVFVITANSSFAQVRQNDLIVRKDSTKIESKILIVEERIVQYKKASDPEGPTFHILKSDIARINYGNGESQIFPELGNTPSPINGSTFIYYPTSPWLQKDFINNLSVLRTEELQGAHRFYKDKSKTLKTAAIIFGVLGGAAAVTGIILVIDGRRENAYGYRYNNNREIGIPLIVGGSITGLVVSLAGGLSSKKYLRNMRYVEEELIKRKEPLSNLKIRPGYNPFNKSGSLSLALNF